jgi:hypothetical protein
MKLSLVVLALSVSCCYAQNAKVIALSPTEAVEAKHLADARADLAKQQAEFDLKIRRKYAMEEIVYPSTACITLDLHGTCTPPKPTPEQEAAAHDWKPSEGWEGGIQYSEDYKFIVPAPYTPPKSTSCSWVTPAYTTTPTTGWTVVGDPIQHFVN